MSAFQPSPYIGQQPANFAQFVAPGQQNMQTQSEASANLFAQPANQLPDLTDKGGADDPAPNQRNVSMN